MISMLDLPRSNFERIIIALGFLAVTDLLWITPTFFAAVYSNVEEGDIPKFLLISAPVSFKYRRELILL